MTKKLEPRHTCEEQQRHLAGGNQTHPSSVYRFIDAVPNELGTALTYYFASKYADHNDQITERNGRRVSHLSQTYPSQSSLL